MGVYLVIMDANHSHLTRNEHRRCQVVTRKLLADENELETSREMQRCATAVGIAALGRDISIVRGAKGVASLLKTARRNAPESSIAGTPTGNL
jgi:hypothetical protein